MAMTGSPGMRAAFLALLCLGLPAAPAAADPPFTTAAEVRPILSLTRNQWVAVREFDGQDLVYLTQLVAWRCGLSELRVAINDETEAPFPLEPCYRDEPQPNAVRGEPWLARPLGSVQRVRVHVLYADGETDALEVTRDQVLMR